MKKASKKEEKKLTSSSRKSPLFPFPHSLRSLPMRESSIAEERKNKQREQKRCDIFYAGKKEEKRDAADVGERDEEKRDEHKGSFGRERKNLNMRINLQETEHLRKEKTELRYPPPIEGQAAIHPCGTSPRVHGKRLRFYLHWENERTNLSTWHDYK